MSYPCQLIVDPPASGARNMAVDEALLEHVGQSGSAVLRLYRWKRPTLSLGYFQNCEDRQSHPASLAADVVRRQSGGGAILHDSEITYSFVAPSDHPWAGDTRQLYDTFHQSLITWLTNLAGSQLGERQIVPCGPAVADNGKEEAFLCFQRRSRGDVLISDRTEADDYKVIGSAQRRRRTAVLQHGSILWNTSPFAPEICGFAQVLGIDTTIEQAFENLETNIGTLLPLEIEPINLPAPVQELARQLEASRYGQSAWTKRR